MNKLYVKNELTFSIVWIVVYCVLQSLANPLNKAIGIEYSVSAVFCILQTIVLLAFYSEKQLAETVWPLQIVRSCTAVSLLCAADDSSIRKPLERRCSQLHAVGNVLPDRVYALRWILGGSDFQRVPVYIHRKG